MAFMEKIEIRITSLFPLSNSAFGHITITVILAFKVKKHLFKIF